MRRERANLNSTLSIWSVRIFYLTHSVSLLFVSPQPHVHTSAKPELIPCLADTESSLPGAGGVHRAVPG
ncbi:hypothetical protein VZT92_023453 [Zoarces viviparus]|uniref:Uncharacterized protein n=1 Tax=Zoarces viviparus TaxID=48416 RepID=A0AAW1E6T8_ZOAVI